MKALKDCEFTAFISYAHADDLAWFNWVTQFRNELERGLQAMLRGVRLPRFHLSGENGPVSGMLSDELLARVDASFAMIIVVHDNYAQSEWCLQELAYFKAIFGERGFRERLYIVAMSETAMLQVSASPAWKDLLPDDDQVWMPFFDPADKTRPLDIYMGPGLVAPAFRMPFERLRGDFAAKLRRAATAAPAPAPLPPAPPAPVQAMAPGSAPGAGAVMLGFVPSAAAPAATAAVAALAQRGVAVQTLSQDAVFSDFADLAQAEHLVLAFDDAPLMMASLAPGGHLELQREAWLKKGKPAEQLHWLDLRAAPPPVPAQGAAAWVAQTGVLALNTDTLAARLKPPPLPPPAAAPVQGVRIYIESNRNERTLWEPLGEQIRRKWDQVCGRLAPDRRPPLSLRARGLPVDQIDSFPNLDDADGVVLLWGRKTSDALVAQINKVENKMSPGRDAAPGIVAYLMPPQQASEPVPAWGWQVLRFTAENEDDIDVVSEENDQLERFLKKVYERRHQRDVAAAAAP